MFSKTMIALAAIAIVGSASVALSYEEPEYKLADRYPFLDRSASMVRNIGAPYVAGRSMVTRNQGPIEDPEYRLADRYPSLEPTAPPATAANVLTARFAMRQAASTTLSYAEDPEYRIGDRYPLLARAQPVSSRGVTTAGLRQRKNKI